MKREIGIIKERLLMSVRRIIITGLTSDRTPNIFRASGRKVGPLTAEETIRQRRVPPFAFLTCVLKNGLLKNTLQSRLRRAGRYRPATLPGPVRSSRGRRRTVAFSAKVNGADEEKVREAEEKQGRIGTTCTRAHATTNSRGRTRTK